MSARAREPQRPAGLLSQAPENLELLAGRPLAVLWGGASGEREVSRTSGAAVLAALRDEASGAPRVGPVNSVEWTASGAWLVDGRSLTPLEALSALPASTLFFLALHGGAGENGTLQGLFETCGRAYTGSGVEASALCMNKELSRLVCAQVGLRVADGELIGRDRWRAERDALLARWEARGTCYVKPNRGGSSLHTFKLEAGDSLTRALEAVFDSGDDALIEAAVEGVEATCGVLGGGAHPLVSLPVIEIVPHAGRFFDYEEKYTEDGANEYCPPRNVSPERCAELSTLARRAYAACGCQGYARIDFIVPAGGSAPVFLELNTLPGLTPRSLLPFAAREAGLDFRALCVELMLQGLTR